jgi:hypothetical protein
MPTVFLRIDDNPAGGYNLWLDEGAPNAGTVGPEPIPADLNVNGKALDVKAVRKLVKNPGATNDLREAGRHLLDLLRQGRVARRLAELRVDGPELLHLLLDVQASGPLPPLSEELETAPWDLPWELIRDGDGPWCTRPSFPVARRARVDRWNQQAPDLLPWPLRVLVVVGLLPDDASGSPEDEVRRIHRAGRPNNHPERKREWVTALDVEVLPRPNNADEVGDSYERFKPHILHFIGHGDAPKDERPRLRFDLSRTTTPKLWRWTDDEIGAFLKNAKWKARVVFMNACRSADASTGSDDPVMSQSIADVFLRSGVQAVVAMQGDIRGGLAAVLAEVFYLRLAAGDPIDVALAAARYVVGSVEHEGLIRRDWALPVLSLTCPPKHVLPMMPRLRPPDDDPVETCPDFAAVSTFVDRQEPRRRVFRLFHPPPRPDSEPRRHQIVVIGPEGVGKTSLARACMEVVARHNHRVCWLDLARTLANGVKRNAVSWLDLLRLIRTGDWDEPGDPPVHREPLPERDFDRFHWELNHRLGDGSDPPWDNTPTKDLGLPLVTKVDQLPQKTFATFRECLRLVAAQTPLYLVLDDFGGQQPVLPPDQLKHFVRPLLFDYIARGDRVGGLGPIFLMLLLGEQERAAYGMTADVELKLQAPEHFVDLASEFFEYKYYDEKREPLPDVDLANIREIIALERRLMKKKDPWSPTELTLYYAQKKELFGW